jgi:hypothetical protein
VKPGWGRDSRVPNDFPAHFERLFSFVLRLQKISASNERSCANGIVTWPVVWIYFAEKLKGNRDEDETVV